MRETASARVGHALPVYSRRTGEDILRRPTPCRITLCLKKCTPKAGRHKFCYFPNTKKIRNTGIRFVGNFILN